MLGRMENPKRTRFRRSVATWRAILMDPENRDLSHRALAAKLGCARGTVEFRRSPSGARRQELNCGGAASVGNKSAFLRVEPQPPATVTSVAHATSVRVVLASGAAIVFDSMPPAPYLAALARAMEAPRC